MKNNFVYVLILTAVPCGYSAADLFGSGADQFEIEFVEIGAPGNPMDSSADYPVTYPNPPGSVDAIYNIAKYEISREMIEKANLAGELDIDLHDMGFVDGGARPDMPASGVNWNEAARFINWLNTSQGYPTAYKFLTQPADSDYWVGEDIQLWEDGDPGFDSENPFRNGLARYFLPSVDEWYKAAFFDAQANGGTGGYWNFATRSDSAPLPTASGTEAGSAVYGQSREQGPADVQHAGGPSAYGVVGAGGNIWEWQESTFNLANDNSFQFRLVLGGGWDTEDLTFTGDWFVTPNVEFEYIGFRVASLPEPPPALSSDCSGDDMLTADDLTCVTTIEARDDILQAINALPGDLDGNGDVSFGDFLVLSQNFGHAEPSYAAGNINLTGGVDFEDFLILSGNFGKTTGDVAAVPEPSAFAFVCTGALGLRLMRKRRRVENADPKCRAQHALEMKD